MAVLEAIAASGESLIVSDVAERCELPIATAHRLLQTMETAGLVSSTGRRKAFRVGQRLVRLLHSTQDRGSVQVAVQPILAELADQLSETCFLTQLVDRRIVSLAWAAPKHGLQGYVVPGHVMPPHAAASAKAILAFQEPEIVQAMLRPPLPRLTPETKIGRAEIEAEYALIQSQGYATCWNEMEVGLAAVAVPITLLDLGTIYALGVSGLIDRITATPARDTAEALIARVGQLGRLLGTSRGNRAGIL